MGTVTGGPEIVKLSKEHAEIKPVADAVIALAKARAELADLEEMANSGDAEMAAMANDEYHALKEHLPEVERQVALLLAPPRQGRERLGHSGSARWHWRR